MAKKKTMQEKITEALKEEEKIYRRLKIKKRLIINFPSREKVPFFGKVGIKFIQWTGGIIDIQFVESTGN